MCAFSGGSSGCEMRDQAPIAEGAELVVDDESAPVGSLEADDLARLLGVGRDVAAEASGATGARARVVEGCLCGVGSAVLWWWCSWFSFAGV